MSSLQNFFPISSGGISVLMVWKCSMLSRGIPRSTATSLFSKSGYFTNNILKSTSDLNVYSSFVPLSFMVTLPVLAGGLTAFFQFSSIYHYTPFQSDWFPWLFCGRTLNSPRLEYFGSNFFERRSCFGDETFRFVK